MGKERPNADETTPGSKQESVSEPEHQDGGGDNKEQDKTPYTTMGISLGLCIGAALGMVFDNLALGAGVGLALGVAVGAAMDGRQKKNPKE